MIKDIILPDIGEGIESVEISDVLVKTGDQVSTDDIILVLESEKATMEIPAEEDGKVLEVLVNTGDSIAPGALLIKLEVGKGSSDAKPVADKAVEKIEKPEPAVDPAPQKTVQPPVQKSHLPALNQGQQPDISKAPLASPSVRKFARELGADIRKITGSEKKGRITREDVQAYIKSVLSGSSAQAKPQQSPLPDFSSWGEIESLPLNKIRQLTGEYMSRSWTTVPRVTQYDKSDITELNQMVKTLGKTAGQSEAKLTLLPFVIKAVIQALKEFPDFNSSLDSANAALILKKYYNMGIAVDTPAGLLVPVLKNADQKNISELTQELFDLSSRARAKKLNPDELSGGTFTITSLGGIGGTYFSPIVNFPEVAILGISKYAVEPFYKNGEFVPRTMLPFSLSYDHRVIDGAKAARFTTFVGQLLSDISQIQDLNIF